ncbi:hypothetical protein B0O80DRAFT_461761, partial [Mortierella sp. GBAus27b]
MLQRVRLSRAAPLIYAAHGRPLLPMDFPAWSLVGGYSNPGAVELAPLQDRGYPIQDPTVPEQHH